MRSLKDDCRNKELVLLLQERLAAIEQELQDEDHRRDLEARYKSQQIDSAEQRRHATVNDSQMVDEMFGFIDAQVDLTNAESGGPSAFKVFFLLSF